MRVYFINENMQIDTREKLKKRERAARRNKIACIKKKAARRRDSTYARALNDTLAFCLYEILLCFWNFQLDIFNNKQEA